MIALFQAYPALASALAHHPIADLPTPVESMAALPEATHTAGLYIKRDDLTATPYGGNKVRKLEFLIAQALREERKAVMTFGAAGSNHALATAIYAKKAGLDSLSILGSQPNAHSVRRNLLMGHVVGAELHYYDSGLQARWGAHWNTLRRLLRDGKRPYIIPAGGSSPLGAVGYVNAAFELRQQIDAGLLPEPEYIYAASGTMGTVVGLLLGVQAAELKSHIMAIRVTSPPYTSAEKAPALFRESNALLHAADPSFPLFDYPEARFSLRHEFYGQQYGLYTEESVAAVKGVKAALDVGLEGTYTGKAFAALRADAQAGKLENKTALFWDTYNSQSFADHIKGVDYHDLPQGVHRYFEEEVQVLDR